MSNRKIVPLPNDIDRLRKLLEKMSDDRKPIAENLLSEIEFMQRTLKSLKEQIDMEGSTQGTPGFRKEHPAVRSYTSLIHRYTGTLEQFEKLLPKIAEPKEKDALLEFVKGGKK